MTALGRPESPTYGRKDSTNVWAIQLAYQQEPLTLAK